MGLALCLMLCLISFAPAQSPAPPPATGAAQASADDGVPMEEIAAIRNGILDAMNKGDLDRVLTFLHPEIVVTWANGEVSHGPAGVRAYYDKMMKGPDRRVESLSLTPTIEGRKMYGPNVLISYGNLGDHFKLTDGTEFNMNSRFSSLLVKEDGKWLMKGFHASGNIFDNPVMWIAVKKVGTWVGIGAGVAGAIVGFILAKILGGRRTPTT
jgi:ketosteroid isomerase-like protein